MILLNLLNNPGNPDNPMNHGSHLNLFGLCAISCFVLRASKPRASNLIHFYVI
jgi:hypothetical protein